MVLQYFLDHLIEALCLASVGLLTFLVRSFFSAIKDGIANLAGRFDSLEERSDTHHTKIAVIQNELKAVWRTIDPKPRLSDHLNGGEDE